MYLSEFDVDDDGSVINKEKIIASLRFCCCFCFTIINHLQHTLEPKKFLFN